LLLPVYLLLLLLLLLCLSSCCCHISMCQQVLLLQRCGQLWPQRVVVQAVHKLSNCCVIIVIIQLLLLLLCICIRAGLSRCLCTYSLQLLLVWQCRQRQCRVKHWQQLRLLLLLLLYVSCKRRGYSRQHLLHQILLLLLQQLLLLHDTLLLPQQLLPAQLQLLLRILQVTPLVLPGNELAAVAAVAAAGDRSALVKPRGRLRCKQTTAAAVVKHVARACCNQHSVLTKSFHVMPYCCCCCWRVECRCKCGRSLVWQGTAVTCCCCCCSSSRVCLVCSSA
jgi:hypothetical protein